MSIGAERVRLDFNPGHDNVVNDFKKRTADLIDKVDSLKHLDGRCASLAMTAYEEACMWAVKLATTKTT